ncbi:hypothetical protein G6F56_010205 [Rhizopus delemar]|nr:hypothetical protein G6F56_010205 [Rhizopus delemar]
MDLSNTELGLYTAYGAMVTMASVSIYLGSKGSVYNMKKPTNAPKSKKSESPLEDSDDEEEAIESLTSGHAFMIPIIGSVVLFSTYFAYTYVNMEYINYALTAYFSIMGYAAVTKTSLDLVKGVVPVQCLHYIDRYEVTISKESKNLSRFHFTLIHFIILLTSVVLSVYYSLTKHWIISNLFGLSFSINAIQLLSIDSFKTGIIMLSGLFLYDIFWVFYTPIMISLTSQLDAPIKLVWPGNMFEMSSFTLLGLGDILIPGLFIAFTLRFDRHMSWESRPQGSFRSTHFSKPYFIASFTAYILGLVATLMYIHDKSQPALLYISPACILSVLITASVRGELSTLFSYKIKQEEERPKKKMIERKKAVQKPEKKEPQVNLEQEVVQEPEKKKTLKQEIVVEPEKKSSPKKKRSSKK